MSIIEREQVQVAVDPVREGRARMLEAAALEIEVRGWGQGKHSGRWWNDGPVCVLGAIGAVMGTGPVCGEIPNLGACAKVWGDDCLVDLLWQFNDWVAYCADDVTFMLRWRAAEIRDGR